MNFHAEVSTIRNVIKSKATIPILKNVVIKLLRYLANERRLISHKKNAKKTEIKRGTATA
jgi:hypothetical protein